MSESEQQPPAENHGPPLIDQRHRYSSTVRRLLVMLRVWLRHRRYAAVLLWGLVGPVFYLLTRLLLALDTVVYPNLKRMRIRRPVFIIGHPRSGTTFLQKHLFEVGTASMFRTWELGFPSLIQKRLARPVFALLRRLGVGQVLGAETGHEVHMEGVEEDEAILLHRLDTEAMAYICPWLLIDDDVAAFGFRLGWLDHRTTRSSIRFFHESLKRQLLYTGKSHVVAKSTPLVFRLPQLLDEFPDARIIYMWRDPKDSILSYLTMHDRRVGELLRTEEANIYFRRKYQWGVALYKLFEEAKDLIPPEQLLVVPFEQMVSNPEQTIRTVLEFGMLEESGADLQVQVRKRRKKHRNATFSRFGFRTEDVESELEALRRRHAQRLREHRADQ